MFIFNHKKTSIFCITILLFSPTLVYSGSTLIKPPEVTPHRLVAVHPNITITNEQYSSLPICPAVFKCPDVNETLPPGATPADCPDTCTLTRYIETATYGSTTRVTKTIDPICPSGYALVGVFNMDKEVVYNSNPPKEYPIDSIAKVTDYKNGGGTCVLLHAGQDKMCEDSDWNNPYNAKLGIDQQINGYAGQYTGTSQSGCKSKTFDCATDKPLCAKPANRWFYGDYAWYSCTPPAGLYFSDKMAPTSSVCSRVKMLHLEVKP